MLPYLPLINSNQLYICHLFRSFVEFFFLPFDYNTVILK